jgi:excinuclease ABC subunit A
VIAPWAKSSSPYYVQTLTALGKFYKFTLDTKWKELKDAKRDPAWLRRRRIKFS